MYRRRIFRQSGRKSLLPGDFLLRLRGVVTIDALRALSIDGWSSGSSQDEASIVASAEGTCNSELWMIRYMTSIHTGVSEPTVGEGVCQSPPEEMIGATG